MLHESTRYNDWYGDTWTIGKHRHFKQGPSLHIAYHHKPLCHWIQWSLISSNLQYINCLHHIIFSCCFYIDFSAWLTSGYHLLFFFAHLCTHTSNAALQINFYFYWHYVMTVLQPTFLACDVPSFSWFFFLATRQNLDVAWEWGYRWTTDIRGAVIRGSLQSLHWTGKRHAQHHF